MIVQDSAYAEIAITTNFSFLRGASHPRELAEAAVRHGLAAIGIADRNSLAGIVRAYQALIDIKPQTDLPVPKLLVGVRLVFVDGTPDILVYPVDRAAYGRLCRLLSKGKLRAPKGECILTLSDLLKWQDGFLLVVLPPYPGKTCVEIAPPTKTWNRELPEVQQEQPRIHVDLVVDTAAEQSSEIDRLVGLGATRVGWDYPDDPDFVVLADTEGNRFCIVDASHG